MPSEPLTIMCFLFMVGVSGDISIANVLVSGLVIVGILWTLRANMSSVWKDRAEANEQTVKDLEKKNLDMHAEITKLRSLPNIDRLYTLMDQHMRESNVVAQGITDSLGEIQKSLQVNTLALEKFIDRRS